MKIQTILGAAVGIVFVFSAISSVVGAWKLVKIGYDKVLGVPHNCYIYKPDGRCEEDKTQTKRELADSLAVVTVALPIALLSIRKLLKLKE